MVRRKRMISVERTTAAYAIFGAWKIMSARRILGRGSGPPGWHGKEDAKGGARQSMKKLVAVASLIASSLALQARAGDADGLTLTIGKFSKDGDGFVGQTLSVKNGTTAPIEFLHLECGFLRGNQLITTGVNYLQNLKVGETGYQTVTVRITDNIFPD
jgi:hypothetical protein